ncbi:MAG: dTMP kinase [Burkholderiales bacterium RIFCSPLOWO2_12_FULL_64_99]|nr:MAG: dTMP kinase [Burkholderiales bacterium RIFCSPHIGHO2_12_FULL_63_20]OGB67959.1 MAG: dTMP kinase [Burkholderiales bacterium RIFCSPLOWO2_12_FULL_64_99]
MNTGRFITFEGIDGAGKTTHLDALERAWREAGHEVVRTREPGGTPLAEQLRGLFLHEPMDSLTEALLVFAARRDHLTQVMEPALARGAWVLCDRFTDATFAYQGGGRGFDLKVLSTLESWVQGTRQPDLTFLFDLPPAVAAARLAGARQPDRFEAQDQVFFERVREMYLTRMAQHPERFVLIQADQPQETVARAIGLALAARGVA